MIFNIYVNYLCFVVYCDFSKCMLKYICKMSKDIGDSKILNNINVNSKLIQVCKMYGEQKVFNSVVWDMLQKFSLFHLKSYYTCSDAHSVLF